MTSPEPQPIPTFFVQRFGVEEGPYQAALIVQMVRSGQLQSTAIARRSDSQVYFSVQEFLGPNGGTSPKSKTVAALLAYVLGGLGIHDFYLGRTTIGIVKLLLFTFGLVLFFLGPIVTGIGPLFFMFGPIVTGIWALVDFVLILVGKMKDGSGRLVTNS